MDSLTEGLSSLTPTSPTTAGPPPVFPPPLADVPHSEHINMNGSQSHTPTLLSQSAPSTLCHIRTDHAYQVIHTCRTCRLRTHTHAHTHTQCTVFIHNDKSFYNKRKLEAETQTEERRISDLKVTRWIFDRRLHAVWTSVNQFYRVTLNVFTDTTQPTKKVRYKFYLKVAVFL